MEIKDVIARNDETTTLYRIRRKDYFFGRWIRRSSGYPTWFGRFFRVGRVTVEREINEEYHTDGKVGHLKSHLIHYPFNKGLHYWFERHNKYSTMEAEILTSEHHDELMLKRFFFPDPTIRRKALKQLAYRIPGRPFIVFLYLFLIRLGFLDGIAGLNYCILRSVYEYMINIKAQELRRRAKSLPV